MGVANLLPSPLMGEGSEMGVTRRFSRQGRTTPTQPFPIKGEG